MKNFQETELLPGCFAFTDRLLGLSRQLKLQQEIAIAVPQPFSLFDLNRPRQVEEGEPFRQELDHVQLSELGGLKPERKP